MSWSHVHHRKQGNAYCGGPNRNEGAPKTSPFKSLLLKTKKYRLQHISFSPYSSSPYKKRETRDSLSLYLTLIVLSFSANPFLSVSGNERDEVQILGGVLRFEVGASQWPRFWVHWRFSPMGRACNYKSPSLSVLICFFFPLGFFFFCGCANGFLLL